MASCKASELFQAQAYLYGHMHSFLSPMCIKWAVDLGIPDNIHNHGQPITLPHLVSARKVPQAKASCVQRLIRLLAHNGFFVIIKMGENKEGKEEAYALTPASELLAKGSDHCLSSMVELQNSPTLHWAQEGIGTIHQNPAHLKTFSEAMESDSHVVRLASRDCKSVFEGLDSFVDVGGGTGNRAKIICDAFPKLKCI